MCPDKYDSSYYDGISTFLALIVCVYVIRLECTTFVVVGIKPPGRQAVTRVKKIGK